MGELLAIDIHSRRVTAAILEQEKVWVLKRWIEKDVEGDLAETLSLVKDELGFSGKECRVGFGEEFCSFRKVNLPFSDRSKLSQILPFELDDRFSIDAEAYHFDFQQVKQENGYDVLVALIKREQCSDLLAALQYAGFDPALCTISGTSAASFLLESDESLTDFLLLDVEYDHTILSIIKNRQFIGLRSLNLHFMAKGEELTSEQLGQCSDRLAGIVKQTLLAEQYSTVLTGQEPVFLCGAIGCSFALRDLLMERLSTKVAICNPSAMPLFKIDNENEQEFHPAEMSRSLCLGLYGHTDNGLTLFNFRKGQFKKRMSLEWLSRYGALITACVTGLVIVGSFFAWWDYRALTTKQDQLKHQIETIYRETQPGVTRIVNPVQQLQLAIRDVKDTYKIGSGEGGAVEKLMLLADISARVPDSLPMTITRFVADYDDVNTKAETDDFNKVEAIKKALLKSVLFSEVTISSANLDPESGKVRFDLKLVLQEQTL